jgi:hypothetical protein
MTAARSRSKKKTPVVQAEAGAIIVGQGPDGEIIVMNPDDEAADTAATPVDGDGLEADGAEKPEARDVIGDGQGEAAGTADGTDAGDSADADAADSDEDDDEPAFEPAKVLRIARMISRLLDEVKAAPLDKQSRERLSEVYSQSIEELADGLDDELATELRRITAPFAGEASPSDAELRVSHAQLVGWLEGLFQGLQTAIAAQQMAARIQEQSEGRKAIGENPGGGGMPGHSAGPGGGMYL